MNPDSQGVTLNPTLLYACFDVPADPWVIEFGQAMPELAVRVWPHIGNAGEIDYALVWNQPPGFLRQFPRLRTIFSMGAGVDRLLRDPQLPDDVPIVRMADPSLAARMNEFVLMRALHYQRRMPEFEEQQRQRVWKQLHPQPPQHLTVGIMGLGRLGLACAQSLLMLGFSVRGWTRSQKAIPRIACFSGLQQLPAFLARCGILVCLLPLTLETAGILNAACFDQLPRGARLIHAGRGEHLVEEDLIAALDSGQVDHATLDVFRTEPLPIDHPFWAHPRITILPHAAALTEPHTAARAVVGNIRRNLAGEGLLHVVDRSAGY